ncbi:MAG: tyrosine--tRNA ligase [Firmicutes bacterium]|nr:tyrosine--tRNA ligase [Bacillota bacterium]
MSDNFDIKVVEEDLNLLKRGTAEIISENDLAHKLFDSKKKGIPLKIKLGIDPTAPHIHLGFAVVLRKMRQFQDLGHRIQLLIGDFTARIGDPTGKSETRKVLTIEEIESNAKTYREQLSLILDPERTDVSFNSQWLGPLNFADILSLTSKYTVARIMERDDFSKRFKEGRSIGMHEILYPLMQGYDSVALHSDVEMGGTDQKFNILVGRELQREYGQEPQVVFLMPILEGTDGVLKMSKSYGNYVGITEAPTEMFGKLMSIPDGLIFKYFELCTQVPMDEVRAMESKIVNEGMNPRDAKLQLAEEIVRIYHDNTKAKEAREEFLRVFSRKEIPAEIPEFEVTPDLKNDGRVNILLLIEKAGLAKSKREAKRLFEQGAVKLNGRKLELGETEISSEEEMILQVGGRRFIKLI